MTEAEWLETSHPLQLLEFVKGKVRERKFRLFVIATFRDLADLFSDSEHSQAINLLEAMIEDPTMLAEIDLTTDVGSEFPPCGVTERAQDPYLVALSHYRDPWSTALHAARLTDCLADRAAKQQEYSCLLRCIVGDPFRPTTVTTNWARWNDSTVLRIAQAIYEDRAFDRMPILADALEDAGSDNTDILTHCRGEGPHVRGCWVVDLLLGKS